MKSIKVITLYGSEHTGKTAVLRCLIVMLQKEGWTFTPPKRKRRDKVINLYKGDKTIYLATLGDEAQVIADSWKNYDATVMQNPENNLFIGASRAKGAAYDQQIAEIKKRIRYVDFELWVRKPVLGDYKRDEELLSLCEEDGSFTPVMASLSKDRAIACAEYLLQYVHKFEDNTLVP